MGVQTCALPIYPLIVGLVATTDRISQVRENRELGATHGFDRRHYTDRASIQEELKYARSLCSRHGWPVIDVTRRSIEETAAAIVALRPGLRSAETDFERNSAT